jgi:hypothetical protein
MMAGAFVYIGEDNVSCDAIMTVSRKKAVARRGSGIWSVAGLVCGVVMETNLESE